VQKLVSRRLLSDKKLDVVNEQNAGGAVFFAEGVGGVRTNRGNQLVCEILGGDQQRVSAGALAFVRYRKKQVGFS
jgi:hypothetical protein